MFLIFQSAIYVTELNYKIVAPSLVNSLRPTVHLIRSWLERSPGHTPIPFAINVTPSHQRQITIALKLLCVVIRLRNIRRWCWFKSRFHIW